MNTTVPMWVMVCCAAIPLSTSAQDIRDPVSSPEVFYSVTVDSSARQFASSDHTPLDGHFALAIDAHLFAEDLEAATGETASLETREISEVGVWNAQQALRLTDSVIPESPFPVFICPETSVFFQNDPDPQPLEWQPLFENSPVFQEVVWHHLEHLRRDAPPQEFEEMLAFELPRRPADHILNGYIINQQAVLALHDGNREEAERLYRQVADGAVGSDILNRAEATMRVAYLAYSRGASEEAYARFFSLASAEIPSDVNRRTEAMFRVARILHSRLDKLTAYRAYREILHFSPNMEFRAQAMVEWVGLVMEINEMRGWGTHDEVRLAAQRAFAPLMASPEAMIQSQSTLELMYMETFARQAQPDYLTAIRLGEEFVERYGAMGDRTPMREYAAALHQLGMFCRRIGDNSRARDFYERVFTEVPPDIQHFRGVNPHAQALTGLAHVAQALGEVEESRQILRDVIELYPDDNITRRIRSQMPEIERDLQPTVFREQGVPPQQLPPSAQSVRAHESETMRRVEH